MVLAGNAAAHINEAETKRFREIYQGLVEFHRRQDDGGVLLSVLTQLKREGFVPNRDIVMALTADEARGDVPSNGAAWLLKERRAVVDAEFGLNEGGRGEVKAGKPLGHIMQIGEKTCLTCEIEATGSGVHGLTERIGVRQLYDGCEFM